MIEPKTPVARIVQNGIETGRILFDQTIEWLRPLEGKYAGQEKAFAYLVSISADALSSRAAVYASMVLADIYSETDVKVELLVDSLFGVEPDVV